MQQTSQETSKNFFEAKFFQAKFFQAALYEITAVLIITPLLSYVFDQSTDLAFTVSVLISISALLWNIIFNSIFEFWEKQQPDQHRTLIKRIIHAVGFEGGLTAITVPLIAYELHTSLWYAFLSDLGLCLFFMGYTFIFQWCFDKAFAPSTPEQN
jgi:uncharacterized membrane protein